MSTGTRERDHAVSQFLKRLDQASGLGSECLGSAKLDSGIESALSNLNHARKNESISIASGETGSEPAPLPVLIGPYPIQGELGRGGFGTVYLGVNPSTNEQVAIKLLHPNRQTARIQFFRESVLSAELKHPFIVTSFDFAEHEGRPYYVMEFVEGRSLSKKIKEQGQCNPGYQTFVLETMFRMAQALAFVHDRGIVHRDFKPGNILLDAQGNARLSDFGLAGNLGSEEDGGIFGTLPYMSPEQICGEEPDIQSDLFSFGATFYEALTLKKAFSGKDKAKVIQAIVSDPIPTPRSLNPEIPQHLEAILGKCLQRDKSQRYRSAKELLFDLQNFVDGEPVRAMGPLRSLVHSPRFWKRLRWSAAVLAIAGGTAMVHFWDSKPGPETPSQARLPEQSTTSRVLLETKLEEARTAIPARLSDRLEPNLPTVFLPTPIDSEISSPEKKTKETSELRTSDISKKSAEKVPTHKKDVQGIYSLLVPIDFFLGENPSSQMNSDGSLSLMVFDPRIGLKSSGRGWDGKVIYLRATPDGKLVKASEIPSDQRGVQYCIAPPRTFDRQGSPSARILEWSWSFTKGNPVPTGIQLKIQER